MVEGENYEKTAIPCKVVLIGESGVGKTSIILDILQIHLVQY